jgi:hypothetical protein
MQVGGAGDWAAIAETWPPALADHQGMKLSPLPVRRPRGDVVDLAAAQPADEAGEVAPAPLDEVLTWLHSLES